MCRDTIRAASRSITACSEPNCGSSAGCIGSPPPSAARKSAPDGETASWTIETKAGDWQTRTSYDFLRFEDLIQRDLAAPIWRTVLQAIWIYWRLVFSGTIARFWKAHWRFATFITYPHVLLLVEALCASAIAFAFGNGLEALGIPALFSIAAAAAAVPRAARRRAEIHGKPDLSALSAVRHDLDLGILAPPAAGMGPAHRPFCPISRRSRTLQRRRGNRHRRPQFGIVPGRPKFWRARSSSIPRSGGTARASSC